MPAETGKQLIISNKNKLLIMSINISYMIQCTELTGLGDKIINDISAGIGSCWVVPQLQK